MDKVSVIIPTYNRFDYLMNTIKSVQNQTYKNIEIIVVNDGSNEEAYYNYDWGTIKIIHLPENTRKKFGYPCVGHVINKGIEAMTGEYFATCDDDDSWFPWKLANQINAMKKTGCKMSCTEGIAGNGMYNKNKVYEKLISNIHYELVKQYHHIPLGDLFGNRKYIIPNIWTYDFLKKYNFMIACSVVIHKDIIKKIGKQLEIKMGGTKINGEIVHIDYDYWLRVLKHTNCVFLPQVCVYYDLGHGGGKKY